MVTLGVSTERGAVHAVVLADSGERLTDRVLLHRVERTRGDSKADVAAAVEAAMDEVAAEIGPRREIAGAAVAYRDAAERRAIVTRLAQGPWHSTSLVSTKSAHLSLAGMMTWLGEYDHLLICEIVPGYQSFTLVDRARSRVLAATSQSGVASEQSLAIAVTAAWDQLEAAAARPDAVVMIGSAADAAVVREALEGFGAPVMPCPISVSAPAAGAAMSAMTDLPGAPGVEETAEQARYGRGTAALLAAASVLTGLVAGGVYTVDNLSKPNSTIVADAHTTSDSRVISGNGSSSGSTAGSSVQPGFDPGRVPAVAVDPQPSVQGPVTTDDGMWSPPRPQQWWGNHPTSLDQPSSREKPEKPEAVRESEQSQEQAASLPGTGVPEQTKVGAPDATLLFPGETPPPPAFTPEAQQWWDNHFRLLMQWASEGFTPEQTVPEQSAPERKPVAPNATDQKAGEQSTGGAAGQGTAESGTSSAPKTKAPGDIARVVAHSGGRHAMGRHAAL